MTNDSKQSRILRPNNTARVQPSDAYGGDVQYLDEGIEDRVIGDSRASAAALGHLTLNEL
jgi:hypothetical protein